MKTSTEEGFKKDHKKSQLTYIGKTSKKRKTKTKPNTQEANQLVPVKYKWVLNSTLSWLFSGQMNFLALQVTSVIIFLS